MKNHYALPPLNTDDLLKVIARTNSGRALLAEFNPHLKNRRIRIENYPEKIRAEVRRFIPPDHPIGACRQGDSILLDFQGARGVVATYLVHEIVCYLRSNLCQEEVLVEALKRQAQFTTELRERDAEYDAFMRTHLSRSVELNTLLEFEAA